MKNDIPFDEWKMLSQPVPELAPHNVQSLDDFETIENLNYQIDFKESIIQELQQNIESIETEYKNLENKLVQFEQNSEALSSRVRELTSQNKEILRMSKETKKALKKEQMKSEELRPLLDEIVSKHELGSMDELMQLIRSVTLEPDEELIETFEKYNPSTLTEVLQRARTEYHDKIIILDSAMKSARQSTFRPPTRVWKSYWLLLKSMTTFYNDQIKNSL